MPGDHLHEFDLALCEYARVTIRVYIDKPVFAYFNSQQVDPLVLAYLRVPADDGPSLLLTDQDLLNLAVALGGSVKIDHPEAKSGRGPIAYFDRPWVPYQPLHRRSVNCVREIRTTLSGAHADEWGRESAKFAAYLERAQTFLTDGIETIREWVGLARHFLKAMGATEWLPYPEGSFPTPAYPEPPPVQEGADITIMRQAIADHERIRPEVQESRRGRKAPPEQLIDIAKIRPQRARNALRKLELLGEYRGFSRPRSQRYKDRSANEK